MDDLNIWLVLIFATVVMVWAWRKSWNSELRDIEPFILVLGALPATFLWIMGLSIAFGDPFTPSQTPAPQASTKPAPKPAPKQTHAPSQR